SPETANLAATPVAEQPVEVPAEEFFPVEASPDVPPPAVTMAPPSLEAPAAAAENASRGEIADFSREVITALVQSQIAAARRVQAVSAEMTGLAISGIDTATRAATDMLSIKTLSDAIEVGAGVARNGFEALVEGSARLSELSLKFAAESSQPIVAQF